MLPNFEHKLSEIRNDVDSMIEIISESFRLTFEAIERGDKPPITSSARLTHLSYIANSIDNNVVVALALHAPEATELRELIALLKTTNSLMRIASSSKNYQKRMLLVIESGLDISFIKSSINEIHKIILNSLNLLLSILKNFNLDTYRDILVEEEKSDEITSIIQKDILAIVCKDSNLTLEYLKFLNSIKKLERAVDNIQNIAQLILYAKHGGKLELN